MIQDDRVSFSDLTASSRIGFIGSWFFVTIMW